MRSKKKKKGRAGSYAHLRIELGSPASAPMSPLALPRSRAAVAGAPCPGAGARYMDRPCLPMRAGVCGWGEEDPEPLVQAGS